MPIIPNNPIAFFAFLNVLHIIVIFVSNYVYSTVAEFRLRIAIVVALVILALGLTFYIVHKWGKKSMKDGQNIGIFSALFTIPMVLLAFDFLTFLDMWLEPNAMFLSNYIRAGDPMIGTIWGLGLIMIDPMILGVIDYLVVWRIWKGQSWRSLIIIIWAWIFNVTVIYGTMGIKIWSVGKLHPLSMAWLSTCPILIALCFCSIFLPRNFTFSSPIKGKLISTSNRNEILKNGIRVMQLLSIALLICRPLVFHFPNLLQSKFIASSDPGILLNERNFEWSYQLIQSWSALCLVVPAFLISFYYITKSYKPVWLWDLCLIQFVFVGTGAFIGIFQTFYPEIPTVFKADLWNPSFWLVNCFPFIVSGAQLFVLLSQRNLNSLKSKQLQ